MYVCVLHAVVCVCMTRDERDLISTPACSCAARRKGSEIEPGLTEQV